MHNGFNIDWGNNLFGEFLQHKILFLPQIKKCGKLRLGTILFKIQKANHNHNPKFKQKNFEIEIGTQIQFLSENGRKDEKVKYTKRNTPLK